MVTENKNMMWAYLLQLNHNLGLPFGEKQTCFMENQTDDDVWRQMIDFLASQGFNTVLIDVGDSLEYETHPEISIKGAWSKDKLKKELEYIRSRGITPIPKLDFSANNHMWLGEYSRMVSTPLYYKVCKDLITEVAEVFGYPKYFHLGMQKETPEYQKDRDYLCIRQSELWWHDLYFLIDVCERIGCQPWIWSHWLWSDLTTNKGKTDEYLKRMPRSVLQSNGWYVAIKKNKQGEYINDPFQAYLRMEEAGFEQVPTCSNCNGFRDNADITVGELKDKIAPERLKGYMAVPFRKTAQGYQYRLMNEAAKLSTARNKFYPEV